MKARSAIKNFFRSKHFTLLALLAILVIFFTIYTEGKFVKWRNIQNILNTMTPVAFLTIGTGCLIISGRLDLSTGAVGTMSGIVLARLMEGGVHWIIALLIAMIAGAITGTLNAMLINEFKFQPFIATLAMSSVAKGFTYVISGSTSIAIDNEAIEFIGSGKIASVIPFSIVLVLFALIVYGIMLSKTKFGRYIYMVGGNPNASMLSGINPKKISYVLFINSGVLGALAGCVLAGNLKSATVTSLINSQFSGVTAAILGGISFGGGTGGMGGAFIGLLILNGFTNGTTIIGLGPYWQTVMSGVLLLFALTLDYVKTRKKTA